MKRFLSKVSLKVSGVVSRQHRRLRSVWETNAKARGGREGGRDTTAGEGEMVWLLIKLHPSAVFTAGTNSSMNFHSISHSGFTQAGAVFPGQEVLVGRSRWEQCKGSGNTGQCSWFRLRRHLRRRGGKASAGAQNSSFLLARCVGVWELWAELYLTVCWKGSFFLL